MAIDFSFIKNETRDKIANAVRSILDNNNKVKIEDIPNIIEEHYNDRIKYIVEAEYFDNSTTELYLDEKRLKGVTKIGNYALRGWFWLKSLILPDSVTDIGNYACESAENLTTVRTGNGVENIGNSAFSGCKKLQNITVGDNVKTIGTSAFSGCKELETITIPNNVTSVGKNIFSGCTKLSDVTMSEGVNTIPKEAFYQCSSLKNLDTVLPWTVNTIEDSAFAYCNGIESAHLSGNITLYGNNVFSNCKGLKSVSINTQSIGTGMFTGCTALEDITLHLKDGSEIPEETFYNCENLKTFRTTSNNLIVGKNTFANCTNFNDQEIFYHISDIEDYAFSNTGFEVVPIHSDVECIGVHAFSDCSKLLLVTVDANIKIIMRYAFSGCSNLQNINFYNTTTVPQLRGTADIIFPENCKFKVPYALYEDWIKADFWCDIADRIQIIPGTEPTEEEESDV